MRVLLIRHAHNPSIDRYLAGRAPYLHLDDRGREQVARLAEALRPVPLAAVISSPLERALETAAPIAATHGLTVTTRRDIVEYDCGAWTGSTFEQLGADPSWRSFNAARSLTAAPNGELMLTVQQRIVSALLDLRREYGSATIALVSHGDVIRAAIMYFLGIPIDFVHRFDVAPASVSVVDLDDVAVRVVQVNGDNAARAL